MNALLSKAIKAAESLPEADQNEVAEGLLEYVELLRSGKPLLTPEQQTGVELAQAEARDGKFATDAEMAEK